MQGTYPITAMINRIIISVINTYLLWPSHYLILVRLEHFSIFYFHLGAINKLSECVWHIEWIKSGHTLQVLRFQCFMSTVTVVSNLLGKINEIAPGPNISRTSPGKPNIKY